VPTTVQRMNMTKEFEICCFCCCCVRSKRVVATYISIMLCTLRVSASTHHSCMGETHTLFLIVSLLLECVGRSLISRLQEVSSSSSLVLKCTQAWHTTSRRRRFEAKMNCILVAFTDETKVFGSVSAENVSYLIFIPN
jgi:hypothetical protein